MASANEAKEKNLSTRGASIKGGPSGTWEPKHLGAEGSSA